VDAPTARRPLLYPPSAAPRHATLPRTNIYELRALHAACALNEAAWRRTSCWHRYLYSLYMPAINSARCRMNNKRAPRRAALRILPFAPCAARSVYALADISAVRAPRISGICIMARRMLCRRRLHPPAIAPPASLIAAYPHRGLLSLSSPYTHVSSSSTPHNTASPASCRSAGSPYNIFLINVSLYPLRRCCWAHRAVTATRNRTLSGVRWNTCAYGPVR